MGSHPGGVAWSGVEDPAGNAWEWVADRYATFPGEPQVNPAGSDEGTERILRGGSWAYGPALLRSAHRCPVPPSADYLAVGFRCVRNEADS